MSPLALSLRFLQTQPDNRLAALARDGHAPAFEALVRRYRKELLAYCGRLQPRSGSAEDALQQTLLQAWKALSAGAEIRDVRPWLYRIAHNVTLNQLRAAASVPQDLSEVAGGEEVHQVVEQRLQARAALAGMAALPALQRDVFTSTVLDGASHEQVASALGLSSGAVRGLIYRARTTLRSAAAAFIPSPALQWALRRVETRAASARTVSEMLAGGGGAGVAAAIAKGGAVLTVAGAVAGAGGAIFTQASSHHRHPEGRAAAAQAHSRIARFRTAAVDQLRPGVVPGARLELRREGATSRATDDRAAASASLGDERGGSGGTPGGEHGDRSPGGSDGGSPTVGGSDGGSPTIGGSDGGSPTVTSGGSDGGSVPGATVASTSDGGGGTTPDGSGGGSDGGPGGSTSTSTSSPSGSDGGTSGGGGPSTDQVSTVGATSDGG